MLSDVGFFEIAIQDSWGKGIPLDKSTGQVLGNAVSIVLLEKLIMDIISELL